MGWLSAAVEKLQEKVNTELQEDEAVKDVHLRLPGRDDSVTGNELGHDATGGLDTESERADIDEDDIGHTLVTSEDTTLDGGTIGDGLIGVDTL